MLDLGCGTATLTISIKKASPEAEVVGFDGDPEILKIAKAKLCLRHRSLVFSRPSSYLCRTILGVPVDGEMKSHLTPMAKLP